MIPRSPVEPWVARRTGLLDRLDPAALRRWQLDRVAEVVEYARRRSRFYRDRLPAGELPAVWDMAALAGLPFTWPADLAQEPLAFLCVPQRDVARVATLTTSGSTGARKRVFFTDRDLERTVDYFADGMTALAEPGQDTLILLSADTEHSIGRLLRIALARIGVTGRIGAGDGGVAAILAAARSARCIVGLPAEILYLCRTDPSLRPSSVLLSGDHAPACLTDAIEAAWHCPVLTHYGLTEAGFGWAVQCRAREGHHLRDADLLLEIVDPDTGAPLGPDRLGEIVLTTLRNEAMPLIRYRTGDLGRSLDGPCRCGGVLRRLGPVAGRRGDALPLADGARLSIRQLDRVLFALPAVRAFDAQLDRTAGRDTLVLTVDADRPVAPALVAAALPAGLRLDLRHGAVNPFAHRAKRRIRLGGAGPLAPR